MSTTTPTPTLEAFKAHAKACAPLARAVCLAQAFAELERERVDAYIRPIFLAYRFTYAAKWGELRDRGGQLSGLIDNPEQLYLSDDEPGMAAYYAACDEAHRAHGFTGPESHCPALRAEHLYAIAQGHLIDLFAPLFGIDGSHLYGEQRAKYLGLILGACLKEEETTP